MFDTPPPALPAQPGGCLVVRRPPTPVVVNLARVYPSLAARGNAHRLVDGWDFGAVVEGSLHHWTRSSNGSWVAFVSCAIRSADRRRSVQVSLYVPPDAVRPRRR
ncbi:hypothetical protein [Streptoalloteichus tenebrarius]|uniref:hypothetical protein n=1 Tax=Streptoalloteichus tenebrarius (strain ATCC 17920 / DSM 40477 / JCM 4838 / CBS 697.72 / NBRC 16177 / NCIMB 11028 / NRRL B-12390 / A12253. 1 / ISP 5477) TaxID=1933 RepID=UPI0020A5C752|nr:hypothetical protein [Streptoalloteichus tenebrarius]BFF04638.1 hypothetical protein GCM10020241_63130 [Streptoalloteichus tenebrarius]